MTLTRKSLKAMGIEDEKIDQIIEDHSETVEALKKQRDTYKESAEKIPELEKKIAELEAVEVDDYREKYEAEHQAFEDYKTEIENGKRLDQVKNLYSGLLREAGIDEKRINSIMRVTDVSGMEIDENGTLKDAAQLKEAIVTEWPEFIVTTGQKGAEVATPPNTVKEKMSKDDIFAIQDTAQRQAAIAESLANGEGLF